MIPLNRISRLFISMTFLLFITITGCKKENSGGASDDLSNAADFEQSEQFASDADDMSDMAYTSGSSNLRLSNPGNPNSILGCAIVTKDTINHILTIDFGTGCVGFDGRFRSGQIIVAYNGHYFDPGYSRLVTFNNYFVDSNHVEGTRTITNNGVNGSGNLTWTIVADSLRVTKPNGYWHEWSSTRTREMISGSSTPLFIFDDVYLITGSAAGSNSNGHSVTIIITNSLRKEMSCRWIVSGTADITPSGKPTRTLDYGSGSCDRVAAVTVNGITRNILLH